MTAKGQKQPSAYEKTKHGISSKPVKTGKELAEKGLSTSKKQARARARRAAARGTRIDAELDLLYKPIDDWDEEELARGLPRNLWNRTHQIAWLPRAVHEQVMERYQAIVKSKTNEMALPAIRVMNTLLNDDRVDRKGRPLVSANVKAQCAQWLIEHVIGKPTQKLEADISVKMQAMLANVMVVPTSAEDDAMSQMQGFLGLNAAIPANSHTDDDDLDEEDSAGY